MKMQRKLLIVQLLVLVVLILVLMVKIVFVSQILQVCYPKIMYVIVMSDITRLLVLLLADKLITVVMHALVICITT